MAVRLVLPMPPSVNELFVEVNGYGGKPTRVTTAVYKAWQANAAWSIKAQRIASLDADRFAVSIRLPVKMRGDIDNRVKPILDALVSNRLTPDDRYAWRVSIERDQAVPAGEAHISIEPVEVK